jgi:ubiquinone/menaquinone biosynthesis C-methylase UbiE
MNVQDAYNEWSGSYDSDPNTTRDLDRSVLQRVLGERRFESIVEMGCGTGKNTELLARLGRGVRALDFSEGMLAQAKEKLKPHSHVSFAVADISQRWPCADRSAELITCNLVLEHIRELMPVFSEVNRVLARGGWFFVSELHPFRQYEGTVANFRRGDQTTRIPAFTHHLSDFLESAQRAGLSLKSLREWWHEKDEGKPPRLISFLFERTE